MAAPLSQFKEMSRFDSTFEFIMSKKSYRIESKFSEGTFGQVYKGFNIKTKLPVAVKVIQVDKISDKFEQKFLPHEVNVLTNIRHENVICIYDIIRYQQKIYIFMEFANGGDLSAYLQTKEPLSEPQACYWFTQIASALHYLHEELKIAHQAIEAENVLLHSNVAKLTNFGFAKQSYDSFSGRVMNWDMLDDTEPKPYYSPQIIARRPYNAFAADVWALGVLLFNMLTKKFPFDSKDVKKMYEEQTDDYPNFIRRLCLSKFSDNLCDLQEKLLTPDEMERIPLVQALEQPWVVCQRKE